MEQKDSTSQAVEQEKLNLARQNGELEQRTKRKEHHVDVSVKVQERKKGEQQLRDVVRCTHAQMHRNDPPVLERCLRDQETELSSLVDEKARLLEQLQMLDERAKLKSVQLEVVRSRLRALRPTAPDQHVGTPTTHQLVSGTAPSTCVTAVLLHRPCRYVAPSSDNRTAIATLRMRAQTKDHIIAALADELRARAPKSDWQGLVERVVPDFECAHKPHPAKITSPTRIPARPQVPATYPHTAFPLAPRNLQVVRQVESDSLLLVWDPPDSDVTGYEIYVNDMLYLRVRSGSRCHALLHSLNLYSSVLLSVYSLNGDLLSLQAAEIMFR
ncbi:uncharacterized protein [Periplaneta americana]|uniref:uncharacterized protein n=1 Tax=Periplaneta americana TaxID=6978 RepID=UPI0037E965DA